MPSLFVVHYIWHQGYIKQSCNLVEHEIVNAHKYKNNKKSRVFFLARITLNATFPAYIPNCYCLFMLCSSVVITSPKLTLMATLIGEVHSNFGIRNSVCRLLRIFIAQNINIVY